MKRRKEYKTKEEFLKGLKALKVSRVTIWIIMILNAYAVFSWIMAKLLPEMVLYEWLKVSSDEIVALMLLSAFGCILILLEMARIHAEIERELMERIFEKEAEVRANNFVRS